MRVALLLLIACSCGRTDVTPPPPPNPASTSLDKARAEFEPVGEELLAGTRPCYARSDLLLYDQRFTLGLDSADFIGRMRALFGPRPHDIYVLRHKASGTIVVAFEDVGGGPAYGGHAPIPATGAVLPDHETSFELEPDVRARIAADPALAAGWPHARSNTPADQEALGRANHDYAARLADACAGPTLAAAVHRLDALAMSLPPADWSGIRASITAEPEVDRVGVARGAPFHTPLPHDQGIGWLLDRAEHEREDPHLLGKPVAADLEAIAYFVAYKGELAAFRPRVDAALVRARTALASGASPLHGWLDDLSAKLR